MIKSDNDKKNDEGLNRIILHAAAKHNFQLQMGKAMIILIFYAIWNEIVITDDAKP